MKEIYHTFRLIGYQVNELPNGFFIAKRPYGDKILFNSQGEIVKGSFDHIIQVSDELYLGFEGTEILVFNSQGNTIDKVDSIYNEDFLYTEYDNSNPLLVYPNEDIFSVYSCDGKISFKDIQGFAYGIMHNRGKTKLLYLDRECNEDGFIRTIDTEGNIETVPVEYTAYLNANNHYIKKRIPNNLIQLIDYEGNVIYTGNNIIIDTMNIDTDTALIVEDGHLKIKHYITEQIDIEYKSSYGIEGAVFTHNKDIIHVKDTQGEYLLNIKTLQVSDYIDNMRCLYGNIVTRYKDKQIIAYKLNLETLSLNQIAICDKFWVEHREVVIAKHGMEQHYTLDMQPLIHDFD